MIYTPYKVYTIFKTTEAEVKDKKVNILDEKGWEKRISQKNRDLQQEIANLFNTKFCNVDMAEYIRCGFKHFKGFSYDKFFREIVLNEYIAQDSRIKRKSDESLADVLKSLKYIDKPIEMYLKEMDGEERSIIKDYIFNNVTSTVIAWSIWRNLWVPTSTEWEYMNVIQNNWADFEKNVVKFAPMLDKWRKSMKGRK